MAADPEKAQAQRDSDSAAERAPPPRTRDEEEGIEGIEGAFASASTVSRSGDEGTDNDNDADADADHHRAASKIETAHSLDGNGLNRRVSRVDSLRHKASASGSRGRFSHPLAHVRTSESFLVDFDGPDDPYRPLNWPFRKKCITTLLYGLVTFGSSWASSAFAPASGQVAEQFGVSAEVSTLGVTLLLLGFGFGPLVFAPVSEVYGRKTGVLIPYFIAGCFSFGTAAAKDLQTIFITRFFTGFFGSAPVTNTGGVLGDIWSARVRGTAIVGYASAVVMGPMLSPIVGAAITNSYLRWRWTEYITGIIMMIMFTLTVLIVDESYPPILLARKASRLRHESGNWALHAKHEEWDVGIKELVAKFGATPFKLLMTPICLFVALYASFVYGILYLQLSAIPISFGEVRHWGPVVQELPFLAILVGITLGGALNILNNRFYVKKFEANGNRAVPEARLPPMMVGSLSFSAGMFVFAWTSAPHIFPAGQIVGLVMVGFGFFTIFQAALNYLVDTFTVYAASAVAANTFLRSILAAAFPLVVTPMFHNLGVNWAATLIGCLGLLMVPIPFLFYIYGPRIRQRGKYTNTLSS